MGALVGVVLNAAEMMNIIYHHTLTFGEVIIIAISLVALSPFFWAVWVWLQEKRLPFTMRFIVLTGKGEKYRRSYCLGKGQHKLKMRLETRIPAHLTMIDVRFIERRWVGKPKNAPAEKIKITGMKITWKDDEQLFTEPLNNMVGGLVSTSKYPKNWVAGHFLYLDLTIDTQRAWTGHLSFEGTHDRKNYARCRVTVMENTYASIILRSSTRAD